MLTLPDVLRAKGIPLGIYKIHLATSDSTSPYEAFLEGKFKEWQERQNGKNFECEQVIGLVTYGPDRWIFAGVYKILAVNPGTSSPFLYSTELLPNQDDLLGRVIVSFRRPGRTSYLLGKNYGHQLEIAEIRPTPISVKEFPGFGNVLLSHRLLKLIVFRQEPSWKSVLSHLKAIYLITDTLTGKVYVGSTPGAGGIWQRWEYYAQTGHGNNVKLRQLIDANGADYADNFQYSLLEIIDPSRNDEFIQGRESHWKDILLSRQFGYNSN